MKAQQSFQISSEVVGYLKCKCGELYSPPVYQCKSGHSICNSCIQSRTECSECNIPLKARYRNISLERMLESIQTNCRFEDCKMQLTLANKNIHEAQCQHNPLVSCVLEGCHWKGKDLVSHLKETHNTKEFLMDRTGGLRGWNSKTWKNADWGFSIWNFGDESIINKSLSTGDVFYLYCYHLGNDKKKIRLTCSSEDHEISFEVVTESVRQFKYPFKGLPFSLSVSHAEKFLLLPAEGLEEGYKRLSIFVELLDN